MVIIVDDHVLLGLGLESQLRAAGVDVKIAELRPPEELVQWVISQGADLVVLDLGLPYTGGGASLVKPFFDSGTAVLVLTGEKPSSTWGDCLSAGALDVISKGSSLKSIVESILRACDGLGASAQTRLRLVEEAQGDRRLRSEALAPFTTLSTRESIVLRGLVGGHSLDALASRDFVAVATVRTQVKSILRKLRVRSQLEAVALAHKSGWVDVESPESFGAEGSDGSR